MTRHSNENDVPRYHGPNEQKIADAERQLGGIARTLSQAYHEGTDVDPAFVSQVEYYKQVIARAKDEMARGI